MEYIKLSYFLIIFISTLCCAVSAQAQNLYINKLKTKQAIENIRFLEKNGKFTYFQNRSGELFLARNFSNKIVMKDLPNTQYNLSSSPHRKKITITKNNSFYTFLSVYKNYDLYITDYGTVDTMQLGEGVNPQLHLSDEWVSYFDIEKNVLKISNIDNLKQNTQIRINAPELARHIPQVVMINDTQLVYTDLNSNYQAQVYAYYPQTKQKDLLYQSEQKTSLIDLCLLNRKIFFSQVSKTDQPYSQFLSIDPKTSPTLKKIDVLYNRSSKDLGHMVCKDESIYFFKQRADQNNLHIPDQDLYSINIKTKKVSQRTNALAIENLFLLDGRLMTNLAGEFYKLSPTKETTQSKLKKSIFAEDEI